MSTRVSGSLLLLIALVFSLNAGAQDPPQPKPAQAAQVDLSGTYTGTFDCEPAGLMGESTLTITGNQFTTADGKTGRIVASPGGGYTAVAFQVGEMGPAATTGATAAPATMPQIFSLRARKQGTRLTLTAAPGTNVKCSFTPGRAARGRRTRTPAATGTEVAAPATTPTTTQPTEAPIPAQTPSPLSPERAWASFTSCTFTRRAPRLMERSLPSESARASRQRSLQPLAARPQSQSPPAVQ